MKTAVFFDNDGTIVDSLEAGKHGLNEFLINHRYKPMDEEDFSKLKNMGQGQFLNYIRNKAGIPVYKFPMLPWYIKRIKKAVTSNSHKIHVFQGIPKVLEEISLEHILGVISTGVDKMIEDIYERERIKCIDFIYTCSAITEFVPHSMVRQANRVKMMGKYGLMKFAMKKHNLMPENIVVVGDKRVELNAGNKLRMKTLAVTLGYSSEESLLKSKPDAIARKVEELPDLVNKLLGKN